MAGHYPLTTNPYPIYLEQDVMKVLGITPGLIPNTSMAKHTHDPANAMPDVHCLGRASLLPLNAEPMIACFIHVSSACDIQRNAKSTSQAWLISRGRRLIQRQKLLKWGLPLASVACRTQ